MLYFSFFYEEGALISSRAPAQEVLIVNFVFRWFPLVFDNVFSMWICVEEVSTSYSESMFELKFMFFCEMFDRRRKLDSGFDRMEKKICRLLMIIYV